jgi:hypothetical protein
VLDRDEVRQLDRLLRDDGRLRVVVAAGDLVEHLVRVRLEPQHLAVGRDGARALVERVEAGVGGDPVQPRAHRRACLERRARSPRAQHRLLDDVLGLLERAEHPVAVDVKLAAVRLDTRGEGRAIPQGGGGHGAHGR